MEKINIDIFPIAEIWLERERLAVEVLSKRSQKEVFALIRNASFSLFTSEWYEGFPMIIAEAFACYSFPIGGNG